MTAVLFCFTQPKNKRRVFIVATAALHIVTSEIFLLGKAFLIFKSSPSLKPLTDFSMQMITVLLWAVHVVSSPAATHHCLYVNCLRVSVSKWPSCSLKAFTPSDISNVKATSVPGLTLPVIPVLNPEPHLKLHQRPFSPWLTPPEYRHNSLFQSDCLIHSSTWMTHWNSVTKDTLKASLSLSLPGSLSLFHTHTNRYIQI